MGTPSTSSRPTHPAYLSADWPAVFAGAAADPLNSAGVASDWLQDHGVPADRSVVWFGRPLFVYDVWSFSFRIGRGSGTGRGSGIGSGTGSGSGSGIGRGIGRGSGSGSGIGRGIGSGTGRGSGYGYGYGRGSGSGNAEPYRVKHMRIGINYLVHCGDWHTFVGRVTGQLGPVTFEMEKISKISETNNGDCWHLLAAGDEKLRKAATYQHYSTPAVIPLVIAAFEWVGELPQEW